MARSESQSLLLEEDLNALQFLPDVLNMILDTSKKVLDDTCVEKLLSWLAQLASTPVTLKNLLNDRTYAIGFLQKLSLPACTCNPTAMVFALRFTAVLLNSLTELPVKLNTGIIVTCQSQDYMDIIIDLAEQLLISAYRLPYWHETSIRSPWFILVKALIGSGCTSKVLQRIGLVDVALQSLEDTCMFVVSATQDCLADLIATTYKCNIQEEGPQLAQHHDVQFNCNRNAQFTSGQGSLQVLANHCQLVENLVKEDAVVLQNSAKERQSCDCNNHFQTCLQKLSLILKPGMAIKSEVKLRTVTIGVLVRLIKSWPVIGHAILSDMSVVSVLSDLLESSSQVSSDMCSTTVEFISVFLQTLDKANDSESSGESVITDLPTKLMNIHQFSSAIQLASNIIVAQKQLEGNGFHSKQGYDVGISASLLDIVMLPLDCILSQTDFPSTNFTTDFNANKQCLMHEMNSHRSQCLALLCHSLSALEKIVAGGLYLILSKQTCLVEHVTSILSLTLGQTADHVNCDPLTRHLQGSSKVTKAVLHLCLTILADSKKCNIKLTETAAKKVLLQLTAVLNNPESDCSVVSKCLDVLSLFLSDYLVILKDSMDMMTQLGKTLTKRSYDPRWEVRDSVMCFLQRLLHCPTDDLCSWFKCHNMHLRIVECIEDGESFVKASAISTLVELSMHKSLWSDLLYQTGKTESAFLGQLANVKLANSWGFARRAIVCAFSKWLIVFHWLQAGLPSYQNQDMNLKKATKNSAGNIKMGDVENEELSVASQIRSCMSEAMFDLDWEVKLAALEYWETILTMHIPIRNNSISLDANKWQQYDQGEVNMSKQNSQCDDPAMAMENFMQLLKKQGLVSRLLSVLDDEDRTVAVKSCQMLCTINNLLQSETNFHMYVKMDSEVAQFMKETCAKLKKMALDVVLEEKLMVVDGYEQHPLSLLQDILASAHEKDGNILDCY